MPKISAGMTKIAPQTTKPPRYAKDHDADPDNMMPGRGRDENFQADLIERALKRWKRGTDAEEENRKAGLEDLKFKDGQQWDQGIRQSRELDKRPCLTIDKISTFTNQVSNDLRQNQPSIHVSPVGDKSDPEGAKIYASMIRAIERDPKSPAELAYDNAASYATDIGWGYAVVAAEYQAPPSRKQCLRIRRVPNPFTVVHDPDGIVGDGSDWKWAFESELIDRDEFKDKYPEANPMNWDQQTTGIKYQGWVDQHNIRVAKYWEVTAKKRKTVLLSTGFEGWYDKLDDLVLERIKRGEITIEDEGEMEEPEVRCYLITAIEILDEYEWLGSTIPIAPCYGNEINIEGKTKRSGLIRRLKDPQRMYNYWVTAYTEAVALAPKSPWVMAEGQDEGYEDMWDTANTRSYSRLIYKPVTLGGQMAPEPQRQPFAGVPQGIETAREAMAQDMMGVTGIRFDATKQERIADESGIALQQMRQSADLGTFHYADNYARFKRRIGEILIETIPLYYDVKQVMTVLREDDKEEQITLDPRAQKPYQEMRNPETGKMLKIFNPNLGRYGVTITTGPSYATRRIEAASNMIAFARALPETGHLIADLIAKNQDWPGAEEMATRLAKALPPQLLTPDQKDIPPQVQAVIQAMDMQIKQLGIERQHMMMALKEKQSERQVKLEGINKTYQAKVMATQEKWLEALMKIDAKLKEAGEKTDLNVLKMFMETIAQEPEAEPQPEQPMVQDPMAAMGELKSMLGEVTRKPRRIKLKVDPKTGERYAEADYGETHPKVS